MEGGLPSVILKQSTEVSIEEVVQECVPGHWEKEDCHLK